MTGRCVCSPLLTPHLLCIPGAFWLRLSQGTPGLQVSVCETASGSQRHSKVSRTGLLRHLNHTSEIHRVKRRKPQNMVMNLLGAVEPTLPLLHPSQGPAVWREACHLLAPSLPEAHSLLSSYFVFIYHMSSSPRKKGLQFKEGLLEQKRKNFQVPKGNPHDTYFFIANYYFQLQF